MSNLTASTPTQIAAGAKPDRIAGRIQHLIWIVGFIVILVGGFILAGTGYRHGLPYVDFGDEMTIWTMGRAYLDPSWQIYQPNYPPGLLIVSATVQRLQIALGDPYINVGVTVEVMRLMSVVAFTIALALVMLTAYGFAGPLAGLTAGLFWGLLPQAHIQAKLSTVDNWLSMWMIAAVLTGIEGWRRKSLGWIAMSLLLAVIATLFKYQGAATLGVPVLACLTFWPSDKRRAILAMVGCLVVIGVLSFWAVFIHKALQEGLYYPGTKTAFPTPATLLANLVYQVTVIGPFLIFGLMPLGALILSVVMPDVRQRLHSERMLWVLPIVLFVFDFVISVNGAPVFDRQYLAAMTVIAVMSGVGIALVAELIRFLNPRQPWVSRLVTVTLLVVLAVPTVGMFNTNYAYALDTLRPDRRTFFAEWARTTATEGPLLITEPTVAAAVQTLYGYRGRPVDTPYNEGISIYVPGDKITQALIDAKHIRYIITSPEYRGVGLTSPVTRLITFGGDDRWRGSEWAAYYVGPLPPPFPPDKVVTFGGEVVLRGFGLSKAQVCPGESFDLQLLWGAANRPTRYYSVYVHLFSDKTGELSAPDNGHQPVSDARPTISWMWPNELLIGPRRALTLPKDLPPGSYQLWIGVFDPASDTRLTLPDGSDHHVLIALTVQNCIGVN